MTRPFGVDDPTVERTAALCAACTHLEMESRWRIDGEW